MSKIRLGFVGVGGMGQAAHLRNYLTLPDCEVVALAEVRPKLGRGVAARYGISKVYDGHRALLAAESLDGIVAIQQFTMHADLIPELLEKGVPVLTEKPLADSVANGEKVAAAAAKAKAPLYLAYHKRSDPATTYAKGQMDAWRQSGEVGKLRYIRVAMPRAIGPRRGSASSCTRTKSTKPNQPPTTIRISASSIITFIRSI